MNNLILSGDLLKSEKKKDGKNPSRFVIQGGGLDGADLSPICPKEEAKRSGLCLEKRLGFFTNFLSDRLTKVSGQYFYGSSNVNCCRDTLEDPEKSKPLGLFSTQLLTPKECKPPFFFSSPNQTPYQLQKTFTFLGNREGVEYTPNVEELSLEDPFANKIKLGTQQFHNINNDVKSKKN